jgi:hypothetical protein
MKKRLLQAAFNAFGYTPKEKDRKAERVVIRHVLAYLLTTQAGLTLEHAGRVLGFNYATILYAKNLISYRITTKDPRTMETLRAIQNELKPPTVWIAQSVMSTNFKKTLIG